MVRENIHFSSYVDHRETIAFGELALFMGWLACGIGKMTTYIHERVMRQFGFIQTIPRDPVVSAPTTVKRRDIDALFDNFENHFVPEEARSTVARDGWSYEYGYMIWFLCLSHPYMIQDTPRNPLRPVHQEIL
ncbi:uncharacterized protein LOC131614809 [Vicia villosa]|uniref:uncharacterized protein LOC131614809 n=1 Tax=Vicia villosa TaxID=3911 RepID=UPI00273AF0D1|nr:uncharacterized protein LOC131614809 [Vicia villosa]